MCKVSVLMPSLNVAVYIRQCIESVLSQSLDCIEILCIDAGSTDGTLEILREYADRDKRIRLITVDIKSYGYQMNRGIREAKGEYIGIVETDDFIEPRMFEALYEKAVQTGAEVVKAQLYEVYENAEGEELEIPICYTPGEKEWEEPFSPADRPDIFNFDHNIWNGIYRREFLLNNKILFQETPGAACQDVGFRHQVLNHASSFVYIRDHFYHYRKIRKGASTMDPKCLRFAYQEYSAIDGSMDPLNPGYKYYYQRMTGSFLYEIDKALCYAGFDLSKLECPEGLEWFIKTVDNALKEGKFSIEALDLWNRERLLLLFYDRELYIRRLRNEMEAVSHWALDVKERAVAQGMVLFGAGAYGQMLLTAYIRIGVWPEVIADNNHEIRDKKFYGISVVSAETAVSKCPDALYLIAGKNKHKDIKEQLLSLGVKEDNIDIFNGKPEGVVDVIQGMFHRPPLFHCYVAGLKQK